MNEDYVSFEVAKLLKGKGFDCPCDKRFIEKIPGTEREEWDEDECIYVTKTNCNIYPRPTLCIAQQWLREEKDIHIMIDVCASGYYAVLWKTNGTFIKTLVGKGPNDGGAWDTYEDCLNIAIAKSLELI